MDRRIDLSNLDLDAAERMIADRRAVWASQGWTVNDLTWMDNATDWPRSLLTDRSAVVRPMSLGLRLDRADGAEVEVVLYAGGWADSSSWKPDEAPVLDYTELEAVEPFGALLDRVVGRLVDE